MKFHLKKPTHTIEIKVYFLLFHLTHSLTHSNIPAFFPLLFGPLIYNISLLSYLLVVFCLFPFDPVYFLVYTFPYSIVPTVFLYQYMFNLKLTTAIICLSA